jgi:2-desacetyl-2-hydroxyethyl bacteriochlorophyllide A dehydrogenase
MIAFKRFANNDVRKVEVERATPGEGEVLVKVLAAGVCGTDLHIYTHGDWIGKSPNPEVTMGHEFVGEVVEVGPGVEFEQKYPEVSSHIGVGSRVVAEPHIPCGKCYWCLRGESNICADIGHLGVTRDGSFAEYMVIPADRCSLVPDEVPTVEAAEIEPVACAVRAVRRSRMAVGSSVVVIGAGPMGQLTAQVARLAGAGFVLVSEPNAKRREILEQNGFGHVVDPGGEDLETVTYQMTHGIGADIVFEVAGLSATVQQAIDITRHGGSIVQVGVPTERITVDIRRLIIGELEIIGEHATQWDFGSAIEMVRDKKVDIGSIITHTLPLEQAVEGMHMAMEGGETVKVVLTNE